MAVSSIFFKEGYVMPLRGYAVHTLDRHEEDTFSSISKEKNFALFVKSIFDRVGALLALLILGPILMLPIMLIIKLTSGKGEPVIFWQTRVGLNLRQFYFYKFRTMVIDAEEKKSSLEHLNEMDGPVFKIRSDPRITKFGRFLRKYSLDELPQFFNVLKGEMSIVGPRPPLPEEVERYEPCQYRKFNMKPGMTCIWQVSGRNKVGFKEWMRMDLEYIDNFSLWLDFKILIRTIWTVVAGEGM
ncbi:MAG: sugar transferase [bacterium]